MSKKITPAALNALTNALAQLYWFKADLRRFITATLRRSDVLGRLNWEEPKRNVSAALVAMLSHDEAKYQADLLSLMTEVARVDDFSHLEGLEDGMAKAAQSRASVAALRKYVGKPSADLDEERAIEAKRKQAFDDMMKRSGVQKSLSELSARYMALAVSNDPQKRGIELEAVLKELFALFDLDPKASFRISGEQIDGAFTLQSTDYLLEAKWQAALIGAKELDAFAAKVGRKLDNTLGLFLSINGFTAEGVAQHATGRKSMILMDGTDLMAVLEARQDLVAMLVRKRRHASQTGNIYLKLNDWA